MATRVKRPPDQLYEQDYYAWALEQAELLRAKRFDAVDLDNLIDEVEGLALAQRSSILNNARVILEHLLKLQHSPARDPRPGWRASVREHRSRLETDLTPRLRVVLQDELERIYARARANAGAALRDHGEQAAAEALPEACPYTLEQITGDWLP